MAKTIEQILGYVPLTGTIQAIKTGIPSPLPEAFFTTKTPTIGNAGRYTQVTGTRKLARRVEYGSPAVKRELKDVATKDVKLIHTFEEQQLDPLLYQALRNYSSYDLQQQGIDEVERQASEFRQYLDNLRTAAVTQALSLGHIYFDSDGNLLPTSSGNVIDVDFGIPAGNQNQLDVLGAGSIISASWATTSTDIPLQIRNLRKAAARKSGYELKHAIYGENIPSYFQNNTNMLQYLARYPVMREKLMDTGELPDGLLGFKWTPAYTAFFEDQNSAYQDLWSGDKVTFTPDISSDWYELMEGTIAVPTTFQPAADTRSAHASFDHIRGMFRYAVPTHNPPTAITYQGDTFLPIIKAPFAVYIADVTP